ncbi:MAG: DUF4331 family protein [Polyangiaceae bacterium]
MRKLLPSGRRALHVAGALAIMGAASTALAADHRDGDGVKEADNIAADINDVFAFMNNGKIVLAMTVSPAATTSSAFSDAAVYVIHINSHAAFGGAATASTDIRCTFEADKTGKCWVGENEYVYGDLSDPDGAQSPDGKVKVFAGLRADPFYFYLNGFNTARMIVGSQFGAIASSLNANGCPNIMPATADFLRSQLVTANQGDNFFGTLNTLAIVVEADPDVFTDADNPVLSVYASTHVRP